MDVTKKSIGVLIDQLITTNLLCFYEQEKIMEGTTDKEIAEAAKKTQMFNARRNALIRAIDEKLGEADFTLTEKTYG